jgi:RND superfamily putative drug exporter
MSRIAGLTARRPWGVIAAFIALVAVSAVLGGRLTGALSVAGFEDPGSEAIRSGDRLEAATGIAPGVSLVALVDLPEGVTATQPAGRARVQEVVDRIARDPAVPRGGIHTPYGPGGKGLISTDGGTAEVAVSFTALSDDDAKDAAERIGDRLEGLSGVRLGGTAVANDQISTTIAEDIARAEMLAFPLILLLSLWIFRGVVAALLPAMMGAVVIAASTLGLGLLAQATTISIFAQNLVFGLSLGLAIDYSLLIVSRYREELGIHGPGREALRRTLATAGRSVLFSAVTVAAALAGLMVFPQRFLFSMGIGGVMVAGFAALAALVLLPAVLALLGTRINALAPKAWRRRSEASHRPVTSGGWYRLSRLVMRRPGPIAIVAAAALIVVSLPAFGIRFTGVDSRVLPPDASSRVVTESLERDFPHDTTAPIALVLDAPAGRASADRLAAYATRVGDLPGVASVAPPRVVGEDTWRIDVITDARPLSDAAQELVRDIRAVPAPAPVLVGGFSAYFVDEKASLAAHLPLAIGIIAVATMLALFLMTGSVVLPVKAVLMNLLTLGATIGLLVWVFQDGRLEGALSYGSTGGIDLTQPILLGALAFGLSTDYAVFLLSRIKEARDAGASNAEAVATGIQRTGRIVTAAALLFAVAVGAFATSDVVLIKQLGIGTALAVLIDATIIRAFLVPSLMALLGRWNWWAPGPLRRFHGRYGLREA